MTAETDVPTYRFGPRETAGVMLGLRGPQLGVLGVALLLVLAGLQYGTLGLAVSLLPAMLLAVVAFLPFAGRQLDQWVPIGVAHVLRRATGQLSYRGGPAALRDGAPLPELDLPGRLHPLRLLAMPAGAGEIAVVKDPQRKTYSATLACRGTSFALLESGAQTRRVWAWGSLLASLCQENGKVVRLTWQERAIPDSGDAMERWWAARGVDDGSSAAEAYKQLLAQAGPVAQVHETYLTVTLSAKAAARQIKQAGGGDAGAFTVLLRELTAIEDGLAQAEIETAGWLPPRRLAQVVRSAYDPAGAATVDRRGGHHGGLSTGVDAAVAGPMAAVAEWDHYRTDSALHATFWVAEWPRMNVHAGFLTPLLLGSGVRRTMTVIAEPLSPSKANREVRKAKVNRAADDEARRKMKQTKTQRSEREDEEVHAREAELVNGHGDYRFLGLITVSGPTQAELEDACGAVEQAAAKSLLEIRRLYGEQDEAFGIAALPLGRGLK